MALWRRSPRFPHVEFASPILSTYVLLKQGVYEGSLTVQGMTQGSTSEYGYESW